MFVKLIQLVAYEGGLVALDESSRLWKYIQFQPGERGHWILLLEGPTE